MSTEEALRLMRAAPDLRRALVELVIAARRARGPQQVALHRALEKADAVLADTAVVKPRQKPGPKPTRPKWEQLSLQALD